MGKLIINILLILIYTFEISAQNTDSFYQYIGYKVYTSTKPQKTDAFDELPERIKEISLNFISNRFGEYSSRMNFVHAQIFILDSIINTDLYELYERNIVVKPIPYYDLNYSFRDSGLGISQFWINIGIDSYGQVISCNFPNLGNSGNKINSIHNVKEYSDSIMVNLNRYLKNEEYKIELKYSTNDDILIWQVCYLQSETGNGKNYHCLLINAHCNLLIGEEMMGEIFIAPGKCGCCDTGIKISDIKEK
jgi:hypothetical protein